MNTEAQTRIPTIGQLWPEQGGIYVGARLVNGEVRHTIKPAGTEHDATGLNFAAAKSHQFGEINGHSDWHTGDQEDYMLAYVNAREHFKQEGIDSIYWTRSEHHGVAWAVDFEHGDTGYYVRHNEFRAAPFRSFSDSSL